MSIYRALLWYDHAEVTLRLSFTAGSDGEAIARLPTAEPGTVIELSHDERLVAVRTMGGTIRAADARAPLDALFARLLEPRR